MGWIKGKILMSEKYKVQIKSFILERMSLLWEMLRVYFTMIIPLLPGLSEIFKSFVLSSAPAKPVAILWG